MLRQAAYHSATGLLNALRHRCDLLASLELFAKLLDLLVDRTGRYAALILIGVGGGSNLFVSGIESLGFRLLQLLQLTGDTGLDLGLDEAGTGGIGLNGQPAID